jgi:hypothetical protein
MELGINEKKAEQLLDNLKNREMQYIQQQIRKGKNTKIKQEKDW